MNFYDVIFAQQKTKKDSKYFEEISDAINVLAGTETTYTPSEMGAAIIDAIPTEEVTDNIVSVTDAAAYPAEELEFAIEPVQDLHGYDRPWPAGGGKNLFDKNNVISGLWRNDGLFYPEDNSYLTIYCNVKPNTTYILSGNSSWDSPRLCYFDSKNPSTFTSRYTEPVSPFVFTTDEDTVLICFCPAKASYGDGSEVQLELGSIATSYEPYSNICPITGWTDVQGKHSGADTTQYTSIPITFPGAAGTVYGGKVDVVNGKLTVDRAEVDLGTLDWVYYANVTPPQFRASLNPAPKIISGDVVYPAYCSEYPIVSHSQLADKTAAIFYASKNGINICDLRYNNEEDFKAAMQSVQLVYELATPIEYDITPQQVQMLLGDNNVWCDTGDTTLEYKVDLSRFIAKLQAAQATPQLSLSRQAVSKSAIVSTDGADEPIEESEEADDLIVKEEITEELAETEKVEDIKETEKHESEVEEL